ncbi:MAG: hypothetical protein WBX03_13375 [Terriglobales bacterium]
MPKDQPSLRKKFDIEKLHDLFNVPDARLQRAYDLDSINAASSFSEKYLDFGVALQVHFIVVTGGQLGDVNTGHFCAISKRSPNVVNRNVDRRPVIKPIGDSSCPKMLANDDQHAMFVDDVELRQNPQIGDTGLHTPQLRSVVRLQFLDSCECFRAEQRLNESMSFRKVRFANADGEICVPATGDVVVVKDGQLADHMIQRRPQIMDDVACDDRPLNIVRHYFPVPEDYLLPFRLVVDNDTIVALFRRTPFVDGGFKVSEVVFGAFDFSAHTNETWHDPKS